MVSHAHHGKGIRSGCVLKLTETSNPPPPGLTSNTPRQSVHVAIGGKHLRVRFSNACGKQCGDGFSMRDKI
jgi:hypothetical protein